MEIIVALGIFFILFTAVFVGIVFFFPEWVGITGKKAKEIIESHTEEKKPEP
ncbi:MAG: hypothetical protein JNL11_18825 [Bdellovibrionaceae bacterium]|nr:hypothetical protein [Pseudobdellovibrionaceae bacterium]